MRNDLAQCYVTWMYPLKNIDMQSRHLGTKAEASITDRIDCGSHTHKHTHTHTHRREKKTIKIIAFYKAIIDRRCVVLIIIIIIILTTVTGDTMFYWHWDGERSVLFHCCFCSSAQ